MEAGSFWTRFAFIGKAVLGRGGGPVGQGQMVWTGGRNARGNGPGSRGRPSAGVEKRPRPGPLTGPANSDRQRRAPAGRYERAAVHARDSRRVRRWSESGSPSRPGPAGGSTGRGF